MTKPTRGDRPQIRVYLPSDYVDQLDREVSLGRFPNRSEAVAYAVRRAYLDPDLDTSSYLESIERKQTPSPKLVVKEKISYDCPPFVVKRKIMLFSSMPEEV